MNTQPARWRTSSYSHGNSDCVECANVAWHTASYTQERGECVEVAEGPRTAVRDSKYPEAGHLTFSAQEWTAFLVAVRTEEF